jgi:hypothetical protein
MVSSGSSGSTSPYGKQRKQVETDLALLWIGTMSGWTASLRAGSLIAREPMSFLTARGRLNVVAPQWPAKAIICTNGARCFAVSPHGNKKGRPNQGAALLLSFYSDG